MLNNNQDKSVDIYNLRDWRVMCIRPLLFKRLCTADVQYNAASLRYCANIRLSGAYYNCDGYPTSMGRYIGRMYLYCNADSPFRPSLEAIPTTFKNKMSVLRHIPPKPICSLTFSLDLSAFWSSLQIGHVPTTFREFETFSSLTIYSSVLFIIILVRSALCEHLSIFRAVQCRLTASLSLKFISFPRNRVHGFCMFTKSCWFFVKIVNSF